MLPVGFEASVPAIVWRQAYALGLTATRIGLKISHYGTVADNL
jgi:hypothetical protein